MCHLYKNIRKDSKSCMEKTVLEESIVHISCESQKGAQSPFALTFLGNFTNCISLFLVGGLLLIKVVLRSSLDSLSNFTADLEVLQGLVSDPWS